jgi:D-lactate dehydrogenase
VADVARNEELVKAGVNYTDLEALLKSRMWSLHCPLNEITKHMINKTTLLKWKIM